MKSLIDIINIVIMFNIGYWPFFLLMKASLKLDRLESLAIYFIIGTVLALLAIKEKKADGSKFNKNWIKLMRKTDSKNYQSKYKIFFVILLGWPFRIVRKILKQTSKSNNSN